MIMHIEALACSSVPASSVIYSTSVHAVEKKARLPNPTYLTYLLPTPACPLACLRVARCLMLAILVASAAASRTSLNRVNTPSHLSSVSESS